MNEMIAHLIIVLLIALAVCYLVIRPFSAIGDIPNEMEKLRESIDNLSKIIKNRG